MRNCRNTLVSFSDTIFVLIRIRQMFRKILKFIFG